MRYQLRLTDFEYRKTPFYVCWVEQAIRGKKADLTLANNLVVAKVDRKDSKDRQK